MGKSVAELIHELLYMYPQNSDFFAISGHNIHTMKKNGVAYVYWTS